MKQKKAPIQSKKNTRRNKKNNEKPKNPPTAPMATDRHRQNKKNNEEPKNPPKSTDEHRWPPTSTDETKKTTEIHRRAPMATDRHRRNKKNNEKPKNPPKSTDEHRWPPTGMKQAPTLFLFLVFGMFLVQPIFFRFFDRTKKNRFSRSLGTSKTNNVSRDASDNFHRKFAFRHSFVQSTRRILREGSSSKSKMCISLQRRAIQNFKMYVLLQRRAQKCMNPAQEVRGNPRHTKITILPQFRKSDQHEVTRGLRGPLQNLRLNTTVLDVR